MEALSSLSSRKRLPTDQYFNICAAARISTSSELNRIRGAEGPDYPKKVGL